MPTLQKYSFVGPDTYDNSSPVNPDAFLTICNTYVSEATLSVGWTTTANGNKYSQDMVETMYNILERNDCINNGKKITFPARAILLDEVKQHFITHLRNFFSS